MRVWLSKSAHVCVCGDELVILDLACGRSGQYLGIPVKEARVLGRWIEGWPLADSNDESATVDTPALLQGLIQRGVLTCDSALGKSASPVRLRIGNRWPGDENLSEPPATRLGHLWHFAIAVLYALIALRVMSLDRIVRRVHHRKSQRARAFDTGQLMHLMTIYGRLRPWIYARENRCLLHCLAILEFLARYDIYPELVVGVRTQPFLAHSWLQYRGEPLTDAPLRLDRLTPILVI